MIIYHRSIGHVGSLILSRLLLCPDEQAKTQPTNKVPVYTYNRICANSEQAQVEQNEFIGYTDNHKYAQSPCAQLNS